MERGTIYRELGVEPIINATATVTILGGSLMPPEVLEAMRQASECFVDLTELQEAVGRRIAELTRNEACFVSGGAAAGLVLSAAVCMARGTADGIWRRSELDRYPREFVLHRVHRNPYDPAIELAGGRLVDVGNHFGTAVDELERAIGPQTAGVLYIAGAHLAEGALPVEKVVEVAHARGVPVIVDAAAQLPPVESLWRFAELGADIVIFSGGKGLCGPASTGLVLGKPEWIGRFARNAAPLHRIGRPMKVGKEDLVGILAAVRWYLARDHAAIIREYEEVVRHFIEWGEGRPEVTVVREFPSEAGQPMPRARITFLGDLAGARDGVMAALRNGRPRIDTWPAGQDGIYLNPQTMLPGEDLIVSRRFTEILDELRG